MVFGFHTGAALFLCRLQIEEQATSREYAVGYKKPPSEHRFKKGNDAAHFKTSRKDKVPDLVNHLDRP